MDNVLVQLTDDNINEDKLFNLQIDDFTYNAL